MMTSDSRVARATPPRVPEVGDGRTKEFGSVASRGIRVLSPRMLPPLRLDDGSTARTATRWPWSRSWPPSRSMKLDLPTPGTPVMPIRRAWPACGSSRVKMCWASTRWSGRLDSTSVIARAMSGREPASTASAYRPASPVSLTGAGARAKNRRSSGLVTAGREGLDEVIRGVGDDGARAEYGCRAGRAQFVVVLRRDHAADDDHDVRPASLNERVLQRGYQRQVTGGE